MLIAIQRYNKNEQKSINPEKKGILQVKKKTNQEFSSSLGNPTTENATSSDSIKKPDANIQQFKTKVKQVF
jgi:hypothetical protein